MPQQSLSDFVSAMEAAGMLVRVKDEKRVDELPRVMEDHPTTAVLVEKITGCEFSFLANAYSNQDQYAWAMGCKKSETGMKMVGLARTYQASHCRHGAMQGSRHERGRCRHDNLPDVPAPRTRRPVLFR